ncbi:nuclear transcription factor Y subunit A-3-like isoform X2 [Asparagus officinalis]|uniref:nuclear transcription factor Y subunit A-3-like isoform X2 n=1 Tax=Asparagus officinalis TaxID=4686 RepID=UPI00098E3258|nr:nuclear transcription factor Y subunit A-3-like isoform X2 [Asparagus officinalis]
MNLKPFKMQDLGDGASEKILVHSRSNSLDNWQSWWNSSGLLVQKPNCTLNLNTDINSLAQQANEIKQLGYHKSEYDLLSTQSTSRSHQEVSGTRGSKLQEQCPSTQSGDDNSHEKQVQVPLKPVFSLGTPEVVFEPPKIDYGQSIPCVPHPPADPYFGSIMDAYGSHATMMGVGSSSRVPLPLEPAEDEPIYVNAKQYNGILRRRQFRAKLEAQNKLMKERKVAPSPRFYPHIDSLISPTAVPS